MTFTRTLEMTIRRDEFLRLLPAAVGPFVADGDTIKATGPPFHWTLRLRSRPGRRLGSAVVPCLDVEIELDCDSEAEGQAFVARLLRGFLRGGG